MTKPTTPAGGDRQPIDIDGATGKPIDPSKNEIPVDDGDADGRSQLSKLALGMMGCQPEKSKIGTPGTGGTNVLQAIIFGQITGLTGPKELPNAKSDAEKYTYGLVGRIEGVNVLSGEMFKAAILYLPGGFHDMFLAEAESQLKTEGAGNVAIAFALEFWSIPANNPRGYSWKAVNKLPMEKTDPLRGLRARALAGTTIKAITTGQPAKQLAG